MKQTAAIVQTSTYRAREDITMKPALATSFFIGLAISMGLQMPAWSDCSGGAHLGPNVQVFTPPPQASTAPAPSRGAETAPIVPTDITGTKPSVPGAGTTTGEALDPDEEVPTTTTKKASMPKDKSNYKAGEGKTVTSDKTKDGVRTITISGENGRSSRTITIDKNGEATDTTTWKREGKKPFVTEKKYHITFNADGSRTEVEVDSLLDQTRTYDSEGKLIDTKVKKHPLPKWVQDEVDTGSAVRG